MLACVRERPHEIRAGKKKDGMAGVRLSVGLLALCKKKQKKTDEKEALAAAAAAAARHTQNIR